MVTIHWVQIMCFAQVRFHLLPAITHGLGTVLVMWMLKNKEFEWPAQHSSGSRTGTQHLNLDKMPWFWFPFSHPPHLHWYTIELGQVRDSVSELWILVCLFVCMAVGGIEVFIMHLGWPLTEPLSCWWMLPKGEQITAWDWRPLDLDEYPSDFCKRLRICKAASHDCREREWSRAGADVRDADLSFRPKVPQFLVENFLSFLSY